MCLNEITTFFFLLCLLNGNYEGKNVNPFWEIHWNWFIDFARDKSRSFSGCYISLNSPSAAQDIPQFEILCNTIVRNYRPVDILPSSRWHPYDQNLRTAVLGTCTLHRAGDGSCEEWDRCACARFRGEWLVAFALCTVSLNATRRSLIVSVRV